MFSPDTTGSHNGHRKQPLLHTASDSWDSRNNTEDRTRWLTISMHQKMWNKNKHRRTIKSRIFPPILVIYPCRWRRYCVKTGGPKQEMRSTKAEIYDETFTIFCDITKAHFPTWVIWERNGTHILTPLDTMTAFVSVQALL